MMTTTPRPLTRAAFARVTGLTELTARAGGYDVLLRAIEEHRWYLGERGQLVDLPAAAVDWQETVYEPALAAIEAAGLAERLPRARPADCFLAVCEHKWYASERAGCDIGFERAAIELVEHLPARRPRGSRAATVAR